MLLALLASIAISPALPYRWVYLQTNLQVTDNVSKIEAIMERAAKAGYTGVVLADVKLEFLSKLSDIYFKNAAEVQRKARELKLDLIPAMIGVGYAEGMLANNPNLVESQPVRGATFRVSGGQAQLVRNPAETYLNGGFEEANGNQFARMGFQDGVGQMTFADSSTVHGGRFSLRMQNMSGNCRIEQEVKVTPHRQYHYSVWAKSAGLKGQFEMKALDGQGRILADQNPGVKTDQDWTWHHLTFNSGESSVARLYMGFWGGQPGKIWLDDAALEEVGLLNVVRRPSCPVTVKSESGETYLEGKDFERIEDPKMGTVPWPGSFEIYHPAPAIRIAKNSRIKEGETLRVDFNHAVILRDGQVSICLSDPATRMLISDTIGRIERLWSPRGFFLSHDEIRIGGWCDGCQATGLTPGKTLGNNLSYCVSECEKVHPGAETYVWNDMFDPFHNAVDNYYLTRGTLSGSWDGLPRKTVVVNWYYGARTKNMPFFDSRGNRQILAGFYDHDVNEIRSWLNDAKSIKGLCGVMYTTWLGDYSKLEAFANAAWGK